MTTINQGEVSGKLKVGLEIHVELNTRSKMFTNTPNVAHEEYFDAEPNTLTDPVVLGMPGVLPVINKEAVRQSIMVGLALGCEIAKFTKWDRKSYYYPDLPKAYQLSQFDMPLCGEGVFELPLTDDIDGPTKKIGITRAHLEEDAGKLMHEGPGGQAIDGSIVDLNRAGTPLLEIVTEPDFESADEVVRFGQALRNICRYLKVSHGIMQKGHMRFEPNINVIITKNGETFKTPIAEIKNLNSFKAVFGAVQYEHQDQIDQWIDTGRVMQMGAKATYGWDDVKLKTKLQRKKEDAHDYRYFPDPDLIPLTISDAWLDEIRQDVVELPLAKRKRFIKELKLSDKIAASLMEDPYVCQFFEEILATGVSAKKAAAMILNTAAARSNELGVRTDRLGITVEQIKGIIDLREADKVGSTVEAQLFALCCESDDTAEQLAEANKLIQVSDTGAISGFVDEVLGMERNAKAIEDLKGGKMQAIGALMGQVMKLSKGKANPKLVTQLINEKIKV